MHQQNTASRIQLLEENWCGISRVASLPFSIAKVCLPYIFWHKTKLKSRSLHRFCFHSTTCSENFFSPSHPCAYVEYALSEFVHSAFVNPVLCDMVVYEHALTKHCVDNTAPGWKLMWESACRTTSVLYCERLSAIHLLAQSKTEISLVASLLLSKYDLLRKLLLPIPSLRLSQICSSAGQKFPPKTQQTHFHGIGPICALDASKVT